MDLEMYVIIKHKANELKSYHLISYPSFNFYVKQAMNELSHISSSQTPKELTVCS